MLSLDPELNAYRQERSRQRNAARSQRFSGEGGWGNISSQRRKAMDSLMMWSANNVPSLSDNPRLF